MTLNRDSKCWFIFPKFCQHKFQCMLTCLGSLGSMTAKTELLSTAQGTKVSINNDRNLLLSLHFGSAIAKMSNTAQITPITKVVFTRVRNPQMLIAAASNGNLKKKGILLLKLHHSAHLSQIKKISISTFKQYIFEIHTFCLVSEDPRSRIISYHISPLKCHR